MNKILKLLILVVIVKQIVWIAFIPLWHFPDEQAHFGQVAYSAEVNKRKAGNDLTKEILISERILQTERDLAGNNKYTYHPEYNIPYSLSEAGYYEAELIDFPVNERSILTKKEAAFYPPLYYIPAVLTYKLFYFDNLFTRVFLARTVNLIYSVLLILFSYKIFKLAFNDERISFLGTIIVLFHPMFSFIQGGVNSDNLFNLLFTMAIFISLLMVRNGLTTKYVLIAVFIFLLSFYTKTQAHLLLLIYAFPVFYELIKKRSKKSILSMFIFLLLILILALNRWIKGMNVIPEFGSNLTKFANINFITFIKWTIKHSYQEVLPWYWGVFRWLSLALPRTVNRIINRLLLILIIGLVFYVIKVIKKRELSFKNVALGFFLYVSAIYFFIISIWDYLFYLTHNFSFGIQGRYFFPVISTHMGVIIFGFLGFSKAKGIQIRLIKIIALLTILLHEVALFWVISSYYSISSFAVFFTQASQYKPWFFKSPILQFMLLAHLITVIYFSFRVVINYNQHEKTRS